MKRKVKISTYAKEHDISYKTAWRMVKANKLNFEVLPSGTILIILEEEINDSRQEVQKS